MVLLISNYLFDEQESMLRFAAVLQSQLRQRGIAVEVLAPRPFFGRLRRSATGLGKWLGYMDKFLLFPFVLRRKVKGCDLVHICDHANSFYGKHIKARPWLVTCHDLLAARGALGEQTDCPPSPTGRVLQRWILNGLAGAPLIVCDSTATEKDVLRVLGPAPPPTRKILLGLNYEFKPPPADVCDARLSALPLLRGPFLLHVGSSHPRKNRGGTLRIFKKIADRWPGQMVFVGKPMSLEHLNLAESLGIAGRVLCVESPDNDLLEALYSRASVFLFPSTFEGFGWPVIEAQACGCPVVCSNAGPMPEVGGEGVLLRDPADEEGFAADILRLSDPEERRRLVQRGFENLSRFTTGRMIDEYVEIYRGMAPGV